MLPATPPLSSASRSPRTDSGRCLVFVSRAAGQEFNPFSASSLNFPTPLGGGSVLLSPIGATGSSGSVRSRPSASPMLPTVACSTQAARSEATASFRVRRRAACSRSRRRSALLLSRIRLNACAVHFCATSGSRRRSLASRKQSSDQASATTNRAASRPSAAFSGCKAATAAIAARSRRAQSCQVISSGSSNPGGGNAPRRIRMISANASLGSRRAQSGSGAGSGSAGEVGKLSIVLVYIVKYNNSNAKIFRSDGRM